MSRCSRVLARVAALVVALIVVLAGGCQGGDAGAGGPEGRPAAGHGRGAGAGPGSRPVAAVPVEVVSVVRRSISSYIETNGTLEAETEVDVVARIAAPIVELRVEEGDAVAGGQILALLDPTEFRAQLEISRVAVNETTLAFERATTLQREQLISPESFEQARAAFETARAQFEANRIQLGYTEVLAPFAGLIVNRYVDAAQQVSTNTALFRISDFDPLLCPIQLPERELSKLHLSQSARLTVEAFPGEQFDASVLRISPVIDAATGTIKVTLVVRARQKLRPGMFARVFVETSKRENALVVPKAALSLDNIGDTVYVAAGDSASRREVTLGFREGDSIEILSGVDAGEWVIVVGQDGLSDGTPVQILQPIADSVPHDSGTAVEPDIAAAGRRKGPGRPGLDPSRMSEEQIEQVKERMRARGMSEEQIKERLERAASRTGQ